MDGSTKLILLGAAALVAGTLIYRSNIALQPELPRDMPADSRFIATGYDLEHNEHRGIWVACHAGAVRGDRFCRITDGRGTVVFQGDYLPVKDARLSSGGGDPALGTGHVHWLTGPVEGMPVPLLPMTDGSLLVPRDDRAALLDRWNQHPEEWQRMVEER